MANEKPYQVRRQFLPYPPIPNEDPDDDILNDERQWKACPIFERPAETLNRRTQ